jgi:hypothetical protein
MEFRIADTFTDSLGCLTGEEQKAVKTIAFDLQMNPAQPGMQFHKLDKARDPSFWSVELVVEFRGHNTNFSDFRSAICTANGNRLLFGEPRSGEIGVCSRTGPTAKTGQVI